MSDAFDCQEGDNRVDDGRDEKLKVCEEKLIDLAKPKSRDYCSERLRFEVGAVWLKPHVLQAHSSGNEKRIELANYVSQAVEVE